jgi:predicted dienelactone hydrolase
VLVAHGNCGFRTNYEYLTVTLASWGFMVAAPDFPTFNKTDCDNHVPPGDALDLPRDLSFLRSALHDPHTPAAELARRVRGRRAGVIGHSLGGFAVVNAAIGDPLLSPVVGLAPAASATHATMLGEMRPGRAVLAVGGSADRTLPFDLLTAPFFAALSPPAFLVKVLGGTHSGFTDVDRGLTPEQLARQQTLTRRYTIAFLKRYLARDRRFRDVLTPADAAAQGADVELTARPR